MTNLQKFKEELPSKEKFYSSLTDKKNCDKEYEHGFNVWKKIEMKTIKDSRDLYLKCDAVSLADVFEKFRNNSLKNYEFMFKSLFERTRFSWDAMIKMTKIELELIPDPAMYILFEKGTRSRISYISNRYSKANNKYLKSYDAKQEAKCIRYLHTNNLYVYAMFNCLPTSAFKWINPKEFDLNKYTSNSTKGCVLKVDLKYPKKL